MARERPPALIDPLRRLIGRQTGSPLTDAQLLENFVSRGDEPSFEVLVWRHEAEDAFQATFLVFARKAGAIGRGEVLAAWLYKVAYRVALRVRASSAKRSSIGEPPDTLQAPEPTDGTVWRDLRPVLDAEIAGLPEKYRVPFVLCHLEGLTNEEAAAQLGCPKGTVLSRLSRGRERLRARLTRRGLALTAPALALTLEANAAPAAVSAALVPLTVGAAISFRAGTVAGLVSERVAAVAEGVLRTMTLIKLKAAVAVLALATALGTGITWAANGTDDSHTPAPHVVAAQPAHQPEVAPLEDPREPPAAVAPFFSGKVVAVAKDGKSFTVETPPAEWGQEPTRNPVGIYADTVITYIGVGLDGAKPTEGYAAQVWIVKAAKGRAAKVIFTAADGGQFAPDVTGKVLAGKDDASVTLELPLKEGDARPAKRTIPFDEKTVLSFSNVEKGGAKITAGHSAMVWYADDGKTAGRVRFFVPGRMGLRGELRPSVEGKVKRVSPDDKSIVVETVPGGRFRDPTLVTITVSEKARVAFDNVPANAAHVAPGMRAHMWLAPVSKHTADNVVFSGTVPERWTFLSGKVVAVAKDGNAFSLEVPAAGGGKEPKQIEIKLTTKTKIAFSVGPDEAKITAGLHAQVWLVDDSTDTAKQVAFTKLGDRGAPDQ